MNYFERLDPSSLRDAQVGSYVVERPEQRALRHDLGDLERRLRHLAPI